MNSVDNSMIRITLLGIALGAVSVFAQEYEDPPAFRSADLIDSAWLEGPHHKVGTDAKVENGLFCFTLELPDHGVYEVVGAEVLYKRIREIYAIHELKKIGVARGVAQGLKDQVLDEAKVLGRALRRPRQTVKEIPQGAGAYLNRSKGSAEKGAKAGNYKGGPVRDWFQVGEFKLELAAELGVDPYTDNELLQKQLNRVSTAGTAGGLGVRLTVPGDSLLVVSEESHKVVNLENAYQRSASDLFAENRKQLLAVGVPEQLVEGFMAHRAYSPADQSIIVQALTNLKNKPEGVADYIRHGLGVEGPLDVLFFRRTAEMIAIQDQSHEPVTKIAIHRNFPVMLTEGDGLAIPFYLDYVPWVQKVDDFLAALATSDPLGSGPVKNRTVLVSGQLSPKTRSACAQRGIMVTEQALISKNQND